MGGMKDTLGDMPYEDLFGPAARLTDPDTSHAAADYPKLLRRQDRIDTLLQHHSHPAGLTDFELAALMDRQQTSVGKRRGELRDLGLIADSGQRRAAPSGAGAIVWRITDEGRREAARIRERLNKH